MIVSMINGNIYKIVSQNTDKIYIGSTTKSLIKRLLGHEKDYRSYKRGKMNYVTSFKILEYGQYHIELIESVEFDTKDELRKLEGFYINKYRNICINRCVAGQTKQETNKIYRVQNRDKLNKHNKQILNCLCGKTYTRCNKSNHEKTKFHILNFNIST